MIIYSVRTKKLPLSSDFIQNNSNALKLFNYDSSLMSNLGNIIIQERVASDVYYTYHTLVNFNNLLDVSISSAFKELNDYINNHSVIKESRDYRCRNLYDEMSYWNKKYKLDSSDKSVNEIISKIQNLLRGLEKQGIVKKSSCNLKRNYY